MAERDSLLVDLVKDVLGPRGGVAEVLPPDRDPLNEYITGVLAPHVDQVVPDIDQADEFEAPDDGDNETDDSAPPTTGAIPGTVSPTLDPRMRPRSVGLSVVVEGEPEPSVEIAATWARYRPDSGGSWQRHAEHLIVPPLAVSAPRSFDSGTGVRIVPVARRISASRWRLSVYLVNSEVAEERPTAEQHVFQPEVRILCGAGTRLLPLDESPDANAPDDERSMWLLYSSRPVLARGHMCSAIWKEIDPQVGLGPAKSNADRAPFSWIDAATVPSSERARFSIADARTEFVPIYSVGAPALGWDNSRGTPELDPEQLAECWEEVLVRVALEPLVDAYDDWVRDQLTEVSNLPADLGQIGAANLARCQEALRRLREGIQLVCRNTEVRLAFCFANKAIALQARWATGQVNRWRPFQLAFILMNLAGLHNPQHEDRAVCDLLWVPTGGGKTEAYLGLAAFAMGLRRLRAGRDRDGHALGEGVAVLSRYTLRLLTIQQFRRALRLVAACEFLRVAKSAGRTGWCPSTSNAHGDFIWGGSRFSVGLWVGGGVTPNYLTGGQMPDEDGRFWWLPGAIETLRGDSPPRGTRLFGQPAEPAQVLRCPCCEAVVAVPNSGFEAGTHVLHFVFQGTSGLTAPVIGQLSTSNFTALGATLAPHAFPVYYTLTVEFRITDRVLPAAIDEWWSNTISSALTGGSGSVRLQSARASRPGYFIKTYRGNKGAPRPFDFDIFCPNPDCETGTVEWSEKVPVPIEATAPLDTDRSPQTVIAAFQVPGSGQRQASRCPIPAYTVDDQVYRHCPSIVVATVDKFARLSFEGRAATLFGNVEHYHSRSGFYRQGAPPGDSGVQAGHPPSMNQRTARVQQFEPPQLLIQDELHLVEGALGSMVGLYETAIEKLCSRGTTPALIRPKYVASTATVRRADDQVRSLFDRSLSYFPPPGLSIDDNFFSRTEECHAHESVLAGRLYVGVCAPGWGALTPIVRVWSALLQAVDDHRQIGASDGDLDPFWTLVGYFNAVRELAGAVALYRQDIRQRLPEIAAGSTRALPDDDPLELSSRKSDPMTLPQLLDQLDNALPGPAVDAVVATSMFGTGVDVARLGLMVVHGQPKTTASYIQATGRVGRRTGGLVVTLLRPSRVRDLAHYEYFAGYHRQLYRHVEPITVAPFSPRARDRALGPLAVALLRQASLLEGHAVDPEWRAQYRHKSGQVCHADRMGVHRQDAEVSILPSILEARAAIQPTARRPALQATEIESGAALDRWEQLARQLGRGPLLYHESTLLRGARTSVVLGNPAHERFVPVVVYENAPSSLREVEATTTFKTR